MDEQLDAFSDGSDIDVSSDENDDFIEDNVTNDNERDEQDWMRGFFEDDDLDDDFDGFDADWKTDEFRPRNTRPFTENGGSTYQHPEEAMPHHYFELLWGDDLWNHIVDQTNRYAEQQRTQNPPPPFAPKWSPVDVPKMKAFIGICFFMGILRLPCRNDYWRAKKTWFRTCINKVMSRDKFNLIWRYLHLSDNEAPAPEKPDRLQKIRHYIDYLNQKFKTAYTPHGNVSVDESMVKFKGRLGFRQYLPAKPTKWGVKVWTLAESETGYIHQFQVYTGKEGRQEKGLAHRVVTDLLTHLNHTNVCVFMDNYYTSAPLLTELHIRGVQACGTVRQNRKGLPKTLLPRTVMQDKHQFRVAQKDDLSYCIWQDTKPVLVLSNYHDPTEMGTVNRQAGRNQQEVTRVPSMVADYQKKMKGVDLADQMIGYHLINHRSRKWWRRVFFHFMMASATNAYVIAKDTNPDVVKREWPNLQDFLEDLVDGLIGDSRVTQDPPMLHEPVASRRHDMEKLFERGKVCVECRAKSNGGRVGTSKFGCVQCNVSVHHMCFPGHIVRANGLH